jgi:hypothetical protein
MADIDVAPKIRCDNCGLTADKHLTTATGAYERPRDWGGMSAIGGGCTDDYGGKERLTFADLCPNCARSALGAAAAALKERRGE